MPLIFDAYPGLKDKVPWMPIGDFPTPVQKLEALGKQIGVNQFYIKRDDLSARPYGGNKIRKLEFILADAQQKHARTLITGGGIGSNFSLATTIYGQKLGMKVVLILREHAVSAAIKRNMLLDHYFRANMVKTTPQGWKRAMRWQRFINMFNRPYVIPVGGSNELGDLGFINAALELKKQIQDGEIPEPDYLFVTAGSLGTYSGLWLGCRAAGLKTRVIGINVSKADTRRSAELIGRVVKFIREKDASFPEVPVNEADLTILHDYRGEAYARFTREGKEAIQMMYSLEKIKLDGTYTGKTLSGTFDYIKKNHLEDKVIVFWDTYNSNDLSGLIRDLDYHKLPRAFHKYFEMPDQELDAGF